MGIGAPSAGSGARRVAREGILRVGRGGGGGGGLPAGGRGGGGGPGGAAARTLGGGGARGGGARAGGVGGRAAHGRAGGGGGGGGIGWRLRSWSRRAGGISRRSRTESDPFRVLGLCATGPGVSLLADSSLNPRLLAVRPSA